MDIGLLQKFFGNDQQWHGPCTIILDGEVTVQAVGGDAIGTGGAKAYAPRTISGRVPAEAVCLLKGGTAVVMFQQQRSKTATGEEMVKHTLTVADPANVIAVEFFEHVPTVLQNLGMAMPTVRGGTSGSAHGSHPGTQTRPRPATTP